MKGYLPCQQLRAFPDKQRCKKAINSLTPPPAGDTVISPPPARVTRRTSVFPRPISPPCPVRLWPCGGHCPANPSSKISPPPLNSTDTSTQIIIKSLTRRIHFKKRAPGHFSPVSLPRSLSTPLSLHVLLTNTSPHLSRRLGSLPEKVGFCSLNKHHSLHINTLRHRWSGTIPATFVSPAILSSCP